VKTKKKLEKIVKATFINWNPSRASLVWKAWRAITPHITSPVAMGGFWGLLPPKLKNEAL